MSIAKTYVQIPPLSDLSGMTGIPGYFDTGAGQGGQQPSNYSTTWPGADPWGGYPTIDPQNYSGGMPPAVAMYSAASVPVAAPIPAQGFQPTTPAAPFDARNYVPPEPAAGPFDARNYYPPDSTPMLATYEPRTSESAFDNSMQLYGGGVTSPVVPPASYLLSPVLSSSSSGGSYSQSPSGLSRSTSTRPKERDVWLYDRPGSWRPRFQMPRSGVGSLVPNFSRMRNFPPGVLYDFPPSIVLYRRYSFIFASTVDTTSRTLDERIRFAALREPPLVWDLRDDFSRVMFRDLKRQVTGYDLTRFTTEPPTPYMKLFHPRLPWYIEVRTANGLGVTFYDLLTQIQAVLFSRIKNSDFYNNELTQEEREKISRAWKERCQYNQGEKSQGVKKVDYLMRDCIFVGLVRGRDGTWEMKTRKV